MRIKKVVFLLGNVDYGIGKRGGEPLCLTNAKHIDWLEESSGVEVYYLFATEDPKFQGARKKPGIRVLRAHRPELLANIRDIDPDFVLCFGPTAISAIQGSGKAGLLKEGLRQAHTAPDVDCPVHYTHSLEHAASQTGLYKWHLRDLLAAVHGAVETKWGDYDVLTPGTPVWDSIPDYLVGASIVGLDLETYPGLDPWHPDARIRMCVITDRAHKATIVQARPDSSFPGWLTDIIVDPSVTKAGSNIKFDYRWLRRFGTRMVCMHDTSTAEHILDERNPLKDLKSLTFLYADWLGDYSRAHRQLVAERGGWEFVGDDEQYEYCGGDGEASVCAAKSQRRLLDEQGLRKPFKLSMELYAVLAEMEHNGACISLPINEELDANFDVRLTALREKICAVLGPINLNSPAQVAKALIEVVPNINLTKGELVRQLSDNNRPNAGDKPDDDFTTKKWVLQREAHKHPVIKDVLLYRKQAKLHGTFVKSVRDKYLVSRDGLNYIFPGYHTDRVGTNRLSSSNPNGQNVPHGEEGDDPALNIKSQFVSRFKGGSIMEADMAQAEIRVAAMLSGDKAMKAAIESGEDLHTAMAATMLRKDPSDIVDDERQRCKKLTFLILYGGGANTLSQQLEISKGAAKELIVQYYQAFPQLKTYIDRVHVRVETALEIQSPFGYRRRFTRPAYWNCYDGWRIHRQAWNMLVQNTAAWITCCAMIKFARALEEGNYKSKLVLQVHDSIVVDLYHGEEDEVAKLAHHCMTNPDTERWGVELPIGMGCDVEIGESWGSKKKVDV